jgi:hypothetical protein
VKEIARCILYIRRTPQWRDYIETAQTIVQKRKIRKIDFVNGEKRKIGGKESVFVVAVF